MIGSNTQGQVCLPIKLVRSRHGFRFTQFYSKLVMARFLWGSQLASNIWIYFLPATYMYVNLFSWIFFGKDLGFMNKLLFWLIECAQDDIKKIIRKLLFPKLWFLPVVWTGFHSWATMTLISDFLDLCHHFFDNSLANELRWSQWIQIVSNTIDHKRDISQLTFLNRKYYTLCNQ